MKPKPGLITVGLTPQDFTAASILLARAFDDNPSHIYIFPNSTTRSQALEWGLKTYLKLNLNEQNIHNSFALVNRERTPGNREIKAMGFWTPPNSKSIRLIDKIKTGWITMPLRYGVQTWQRMSEVTNAIAKIKSQVTQEKPVWYLNNMAVAQDLRGQGVGTKMLREQLESVVAPSGYRAILMTQKPRNVGFYQKLGFVIADQSIIGTGDYKFTSWCLVFN